MLGRSDLLAAMAVLVAALAAFVITRAIVIQQAPITVMSRLEGLIAQGAGGWNACFHNRVYGPRAGAARRANPDSIITSMAYDLSGGPVRLSGEVWPRYWSLSLYQQNSDNYFVVNDRALDGPEFDFVLTYKDQTVGDVDAVEISSPTQKGIMLIRRFAADAADMPAITANQDAMRCGPLAAG